MALRRSWKHRVGVRLEHFPKALWPRRFEKEVAYYEVIEIEAADREEAAHKAWKEHGERWMRLMLPRRGRQGYKPRVKLDVDAPQAFAGQFIGRFGAITVHEGDINVGQ